MNSGNSNITSPVTPLTENSKESLEITEMDLYRLAKVYIEIGVHKNLKEAFEGAKRGYEFIGIDIFYQGPLKGPKKLLGRHLRTRRKQKANILNFK